MKYLNDLSQDQLKEVLFYSPDTGLFIRRKQGRGTRCKIGDVAGSTQVTGYVAIQVLSIMYRAHRLAWLYVYGEWPQDQIDHVNGIRDDNRICNLRQATNSENKMNTKIMKNNTSGYKGVHWCKTKNKWQAKITVNKKYISLGQFDNAESAGAAYQDAADKYHQEFANY